MIQRKRLKWVLMSFLTIMIFSYNINHIFAAADDCTYTINGVPVGSGYSSGNGYNSSGSCSEGEHTYCNVHDVAAEEHIQLEEDIYDANKKPIGKALLIKDIYKLVAGRFVGIDAYEDYKKTFYVSMNPVCVKGVWRSYTVTVCCTCGGNGGCWDEVVEYMECSSCTPNRDQCYGEQESRLNYLISTVDPTPSYEALRQDVNDIEVGTTDKDGDPKYPAIEVPLSDMYKKVSGTGRNGDTAWKSITYTYTYNLTQDWMNPYAGTVAYDTPDDTLKENLKNEFGSMFGIEKFTTQLTEDDRETYIRVDEQVVSRNSPIHVGHYYVPLNATSNDSIKYYIVPKVDEVNHPDKKRSVQLCESLINKYNKDLPGREYWADFVTDPEGHKFARTTPAEEAINIIRAGNGCYLSIYAEFGIEQGFYNEVKSGKTSKLSGYNFYYRPIDHTVPFPNGLSKSSYWVDLYEYDGNNNTIPYDYIDNGNGLRRVTRYLDNSYDKVTYETNEDYNIHNIRKYNELGDAEVSQASINKNTYNDWNTLNLSGVSNFINSKEKFGVTRTDECESFYALGCGPSNADWEECKKRQSRVCDNE